MNSSPHQVTRMIGLLFILASLSGCVGQAPVTTSQSTNRQPPTVTLQPAPKQTSTQPTLPATVAAVTAAPLPAPTDAAKAGAPFPINLSNTTLEPTEIAGFKKPNPVYYSMTEDGQGTLHVIWQSFGGQLWHKQRPASGGWSEAVALPTSTGNRADQSSLLTAPDGKACVLWVDEDDAFHPLCQTGGQWTEVSGMVRMKPVDRSVHFEGYQAQFDPQGDLIILTLRRGSPSDGYYLGDDRLFPQDNTSMDVLFQFRIDGQGAYHVAFLHGQAAIYRMSADQGKTWQERQLNSSRLLNDQYAEIAPGAKRFFHCLFLFGGPVRMASWISSQGEMPGVALFNRDEISKLIGRDDRYSPYSMFVPQGVAQDGEERLHFLAYGLDGFYYVRLAKDGTWSLQQIRGDSGLPVFVFGQKNTVSILYSTVKGLYFVSPQ